MKFAAFCLLSVFAFQCSGQEPAHITFFREKSDGNRFLVGYKQMANKERDWVPPQYWGQIYLDGRHVAKLHTERFVTFEVPPGRHEIRVNRTERIVFTVKPGERVYVHPGVQSKAHSLVYAETVEIPSCHEVTAFVAGHTLEPVKPKDIYFGEVAPESSFPTCAAE